MQNKNIFFVIGIILTYVILFFVPSLRFLPIPFGLFFLFSYKYFVNFKKALFISSVFALPYSFGKTLLQIDDAYYIVVAPFVISTIPLSLFSLAQKTKIRLVLPDILLFLFFLWAIFTFLFFHTISVGMLDGIYKLGISALFYFLCRIYMQDRKIQKTIVFLLITFIIFEVGITILQSFLGHPLGKFIEEANILYPYGKVASEDVTLYRPAGTMGGPTLVSRFLVMLLPFVILNPKNIFSLSKKIRLLLIGLTFVAVFSTLTRLSWFTSVAVSIICLFLLKRTKAYLKYINMKNITAAIAFSSIAIFFIAPLLVRRLETTTISLEKYQSWNLRIDLAYEALNLIQQYPLFGIGMGIFLTKAGEENITGIFNYSDQIVHNQLLLISSEMGIPAALIFVAFVISVYVHFFRRKKYIVDKNKQYFQYAAFLGTLVFLLETSVNATFFGPHFLLFLLYMAIISA